MAEIMKTCTKCGETKPLTDFYKDKHSKDGLTYRCRECNRADGKAYHEANLEKEKVRSKFYYDNNTEACLARNRAWMRTPAGKEAQQRHDSKRRTYGYDPLNEPFEDSHYHHLQTDEARAIGIYIPKELHDSVSHSSTTWKGMDEMNKLAILYLWKDVKL